MTARPSLPPSKGSSTRYRQLDGEAIISTSARLEERIASRLPGANLRLVCAEVTQLAERACQRAEDIARPHLMLRVAIFAVIAVFLGLIALGIMQLRWDEAPLRSMEAVTWLESAVNQMVFAGIAIAFLLTWETRIKRRRVLKALHRIRSVAHVIDMHQLTKDPDRLSADWQESSVSPRHALTAFELSRYLNYCAEMLALCGKIAALYVERFDDAPAVSAVNDIEQLVNGLSSKIFEKLAIVDRTVMSATDRLPDSPP